MNCGQVCNRRMGLFGNEIYHWQIALCKAFLLSKVIFSWTLIVSNGPWDRFGCALQRRMGLSVLGELVSIETEIPTDGR